MPASRKYFPAARIGCRGICIGGIEVIFPIEDGNLRGYIISELLALPLQDNVKARIMRADGTYVREKVKRGQAPHRSQMEFIARTLARTRT